MVCAVVRDMVCAVVHDVVLVLVRDMVRRVLRSVCAALCIVTTLCIMTKYLR